MLQFRCEGHITLALGSGTGSLRWKHGTGRRTGLLVIRIRAKRRLADIAGSSSAAYALDVQNGGGRYAPALVEVTTQAVHDQADPSDDISTEWRLSVRILVEHHQQGEEPVASRILLQVPQGIVEDYVLVGFTRGARRIWRIENDLHDRGQDEAPNQMVLVQNLRKIGQESIKNGRNPKYKYGCYSPQHYQLRISNTLEIPVWYGRSCRFGCDRAIGTGA